MSERTLELKVHLLEQAVFKNEQTGEPGISPRLTALERRIDRLLTSGRWLLTGLGINILLNAPEFIQVVIELLK